MFKIFDFEFGDLIEYAGDRYIVINNFGTSGYVREYYADGSMSDELITFYWRYDGEDCKLLKKGKIKDK